MVPQWKSSSSASAPSTPYSYFSSNNIAQFNTRILYLEIIFPFSVTQFVSKSTPRLSLCSFPLVSHVGNRLRPPVVATRSGGWKCRRREAESSFLTLCTPTYCNRALRLTNLTINYVWRPNDNVFVRNHTTKYIGEQGTYDTKKRHMSRCFLVLLREKQKTPTKLVLPHASCLNLCVAPIETR